MQIRMLTSIAGADLTARPGEVVECEPLLAARLIDSDQAVAVDGAPEAAAVGGAPEVATTARAQPRRRGKRG